MLTINGHKFAKNEQEAINSLFGTGGTFYGFYKKLKGRIHLLDMQGEIFAAVIVNNAFSGIVNARKLNGKVFYQFAASEKNEKLLGVPSFSKQSDYARSIFNNV